MNVVLEQLQELIVADKGQRLDIRPLAQRIVNDFGGLDGLGQEVVRLYTETNDANKVRLMLEFFKLINQVADETDDLPEDPEELAAIAATMQSMQDGNDKPR